MDRLEGDPGQRDTHERDAHEKIAAQAENRENDLPTKRDPMALAMEWVAKITTVSLEMVLPGVFGQWLDSKWGTGFLALAGFALGIAVGMWHLLQMTKAPNDKR
jgi:hypothetical protein